MKSARLLTLLAAVLFLPLVAKAQNEPEEKVEITRECTCEGDGDVRIQRFEHVGPGDALLHDRIGKRMALPDGVMAFAGGPLEKEVRVMVRNSADMVEMVGLENEARELARELRNASGAEKSRLETELRQKLDVIFEKRLEARRQELKELKEEVATAESNLEERQEAKEQIIEERMDDLLGKENHLDW